MTSAEILQELTRLLETEYRVERRNINADATFRGTLKLDSLDVLQLIEDVEEKFGIRAELAEYRDLHTVGRLVEFIAARGQ